jgi:hypothetical protein
MLPQAVVAAGGAALVVTYLVNRGRDQRLVRAFSGGPGGAPWPAELTVAESDQERLVPEQENKLVRRPSWAAKCARRVPPTTERWVAEVRLTASVSAQV